MRVERFFNGTYLLLEIVSDPSNPLDVNVEQVAVCFGLEVVDAWEWLEEVNQQPYHILEVPFTGSWSEWQQTLVGVHQDVIVRQCLRIQVELQDDPAAAIRVCNLFDVAVDVVEVVVVEQTDVVHDQPLLLLHAPPYLLSQPFAFTRALVVYDCVANPLPGPDRFKHLLLFEHYCRDAWCVVIFD